MNAWQPIETAPKDGTWILMRGYPHIDYPPVTVARVEGKRFRSEVYSVEVRAMDCGSHTWVLSEFTHWMPLPEPPPV